MRAGPRIKIYRHGKLRKLYFDSLILEKSIWITNKRNEIFNLTNQFQNIMLLNSERRKGEKHLPSKISSFKQVLFFYIRELFLEG